MEGGKKNLFTVGRKFTGMEAKKKFERKKGRKNKP
jgi:hypothetical protein